MRARSVVIDLFGDYLRYAGGEVRLQALSRMVECFDIGSSTLRVVMARLRREEWLDARRDGRETIYSLNARSWQLLDEGRSRIFDRAALAWDGEWSMVIYSVPEVERAVREAIRKELAWLGFGPLATSTWVSPHKRLDRAAQVLEGRPLMQADLLTCRSGDLERDRLMASRCWDLDELNAEYAALLVDLQQRISTYKNARLSAEQALVERVSLTHAYRLFPFKDPDLPIELLPVGWEGLKAHDMFLEARELLRPQAEALVASTLNGALS